MKINDRVYGSFEITEPVLLELIESKPLQRLKGINQAGAASFVHPQLDVTRYEHCIGVMHLLKRLGANLEEQIAGLLHDVPHTAFSHVADVLFKNKDESYHELFHETIIMNSEIPTILDKYGFCVKRQFDEHNFSLLERNLPDLCADRIDYAFRDTIAFLHPMVLINDCLNSLTVWNNEIMFSDIGVAHDFAQTYLMMSQQLWAHPLNTASYKILADALQIGLDNGIISEKSLFGEDDGVYDLLLQSNNSSILEKLKQLNPSLEVELNSVDYDFHDRTKIRVINPKIHLAGTITTVGDHFPKYIHDMEEEKERIRNGAYVKLLSW